MPVKLGNLLPVATIPTTSCSTELPVGALDEE